MNAETQSPALPGPDSEEGSSGLWLFLRLFAIHLIG
jgi:hypothetical protein